MRSHEYQAAVVISALSDGNRTVARASLTDHAKFPSTTTGTGSSGRRPGDKADREVGEDLAIARALRSLANRLERRATGSMKHQEDIKAHKEQIDAQRDLRRIKTDDGPVQVKVDRDTGTVQLGFRTWSDLDRNDGKNL